MNDVSSDVGLNSDGTASGPPTGSGVTFGTGLIVPANSTFGMIGSFTEPLSTLPLPPVVPLPLPPMFDEMLTTLSGSNVNREGVCERDGLLDELRDTGLEFWERRKSSSGISSERGRGMRGLDSLDRGVPDRLRELSRDFSELDPMPIGWLLSRRVAPAVSFLRVPVGSLKFERLDGNAF